jgi:hypothetical protein
MRQKVGIDKSKENKELYVIKLLSVRVVALFPSDFGQKQFEYGKLIHTPHRSDSKSVADPEPNPEPSVLRPPGSGSGSTRYGSGFGSRFYRVIKQK